MRFRLTRLACVPGLPSYLYEEACVKGDFRRSLKLLRADGEYEGARSRGPTSSQRDSIHCGCAGLPAKLKDPRWAPDYGPTEFVPSWGVTATGARPILIAYNINVLGTKEQVIHNSGSAEQGSP